ncbi:putative hydrolase [Helianthus annuus]|nr:putative hydrolase [Helianthus annuus]
MESQTLSSHETETVANQRYSAHDVADAFVTQYYKILQGNPKEAHNFYKDQSVRAHPCLDGSMKSVTTQQGIDDEIMASNVKEWNPDLSTLHAQDSLMDSVIVGVTGYLIDKDGVSRNFAQTFFLAPQEGGGFYVHNDFLQFIEIKNISESSPSLDDVANPLAVQQADDTAKDTSMETAHAANKDQTEKSTTSTKEDSDTKVKVSESSEGKKPLPAEPKKKSQPSVWEQPPKIQEDSKKVSYASILAKEGAGPSTTQTSPSAAVKAMPKTEKRASTSSVVPKPSIIPNNGPSDGIYDVKSIRVKDLPPKLTQESLLEAVRQFGPVKEKNIQIKEYSQDGYRYAFVEFDNPKSAQTAVEARYIRFEDRVSEIQYKIIPNQGHNNMGRPSYGRGGFKPESSWRRDGEGRGSGSWGNKHVDHENVGQHSGQAREYNQRRNRYFQDRQ